MEEYALHLSVINLALINSRTLFRDMCMSGRKFPEYWYVVEKVTGTAAGSGGHSLLLK